MLSREVISVSLLKILSLRFRIKSLCRINAAVIINHVYFCLKTTIVKTEYTYRKIWIITYPVLISLLMQNLIGITDTAFLGRVGEIELGASALGGIFYMVVYMAGFGFGVGGEILIGRRNGERHFRAIGNLFYHTLAVLIVMAGIIVLLSHFLSPVILRAIISSEKILQATVSFTSWRIYGLFFSFIVIAFRAYYMGTTKTKILTLNGIVMVVSNILLNYALVFGKLGMPALGIVGSAIASVISEAVAAVFFIVYSRFFTDYSQYGLFGKGRFRMKTVEEIFGVSKWTMIQFVVSCGTWMFFFLAIEHLGERELAISNIVRNTSMMLYLFVSAFATTGIAMVSNLMGQGDQEKIMGLCGRIIKMCALCTLPFIIFSALFPEIVMRVYTDNAELIRSSVASLRVMLVSYLFGIPAFVYFLAIAGTGNTKVTFWIEISVLVLYIAFTYLFAIHLRADVAVTWSVETIYCMALLLLSYAYMKKGRWKGKII